jgi:hypothetical protein
LVRVFSRAALAAVWRVSWPSGTRHDFLVDLRMLVKPLVMAGSYLTHWLLVKMASAFDVDGDDGATFSIVTL